MTTPRNREEQELKVGEYYHIDYGYGKLAQITKIKTLGSGKKIISWRASFGWDLDEIGWFQRLTGWYYTHGHTEEQFREKIL